MNGPLTLAVFKFINFIFVFVSGPPRADVKVLKKIGHLGENIRLQCPIEGFPPPIFEWTKVN